MSTSVQAGVKTLATSEHRTVADNQRASGCQQHGKCRPFTLTGRTRSAPAYCSSQVSAIEYYNLVDLSHIQDEEKRAQILKMLAPHKDMWSGDLGKIWATEHRIDLKPNTRTVHQQPYRARAESRKALEDHINLLLAADLIEPAQSEWASPVLLAPKDGTLRFCIDFRRLNTVTIFDTYTLPRMEDCIDSLR